MSDRTQEEEVVRELEADEQARITKSYLSSVSNHPTDIILLEREEASEAEEVIEVTT